MDLIKLTIDKLSVDEISDLVSDDMCGAISIFVGTTRDNFEGKKVLRLEYEAYEPMAIKSMKSICNEIRDKWTNVHNIAIYHRLGNVPVRESSVVIAISSPHRADSLAAVSHCIDRLKATVPIWKKEVYETTDGVWKENAECPKEIKQEIIETPIDTQTQPVTIEVDTSIDKNLVQINVSSEELNKRIQNFIERKREQVNLSNILDFIPDKSINETEDTETCARVRTKFVKRSDSKGHLKIRKVYNEWGPQTIPAISTAERADTDGLPSAIAERVLSIEKYLNIAPVSKDVYKRLKVMEDKIAELDAVSPEYAQFWKRKPDEEDTKQLIDYAFSADDIARKIEQLERMNM